MCHHGTMDSTFFVDVWSDVVCPFCYLGSRQLAQAVSRCDFTEEIVIRHHAFELDPHAPLAYGGTLNQMLAEKYSIPLERATALNQGVEDSARALGMRWSLATARPTNTFDAHRVVALATQHELQGAMLERLFRAYFSDGLLVSDRETLVALAEEVGVAGVDALLDGDALADEVRLDEQRARQLGINGVPALIFNSDVLVSGAQGADAMLEALNEAWSNRSGARA